jgi:hypothetical protein
MHARHSSSSLLRMMTMLQTNTSCLETSGKPDLAVVASLTLCHAADIFCALR